VRIVEPQQAIAVGIMQREGVLQPIAVDFAVAGTRLIVNLRQ
jgi:hypothetical protein